MHTHAHEHKHTQNLQFSAPEEFFFAKDGGLLILSRLPIVGASGTGELQITSFELENLN